MALALVLLSAPTALAGAGSGPVKQARELHDARYCEILELRGALPSARVSVWNTVGLGICPASWWASLSATSLARERGDTLVVLNGPRHFLMDRASAVTGIVHRFRGQRLTMVASIAIHSAADLVQTPYTERVITRTNTWSWNSGRTVYELVSDRGRSYVMQSYSQIKDRSLKLSALRGLGHRLALPRGWRYRTRRLAHPLVLTAQRTATITQDELQDTYQRISPKQASEIG